MHLTIAGPNARRRRRPGLTLHVVRSLPAEDRVRHHGLPVTSPERTLLDLAGLLPSSAVARVAEEAQVRRLVRRGDIAALLKRHPAAAGVARLRRLIEDEPRVTRSEAERRLLSLLGRAGLPLPRTNVRIHGHEVDALWPERRLVAEVDGFAFHRSRAAFERDRRRDAALAARGYRVVRFTWRRMSDEPERIAIELAELLRPPA